MRVVLLQDVPKLGRKYELKNVADGYAVNMLIPRGLAVYGTEEAKKKADQQKLTEIAKEKIREDLLIKNIHSIEGVTIEMIGKANEKGHLFAGIHKEEIIAELKKQTRLEIYPEFLLLEKPIKEVGEHEVKVAVGDKKASFKVVVKEKE